MDVGLIGAQISKFRKARGMTQEELGKRVGVSTQAVSRWECGGAPDIALLPEIADTLGVATDALFGREDALPDDMEGMITKWAAALPKEELLDTLVRLIWRCCMSSFLYEKQLVYLDGFEKGEITQSGVTLLSKSEISFENGYMMGSYAKDISFMMVMPEPKEGYARFFASCDEYRKLFLALSQPLCLEILFEMHTVPDARIFTASAMANRLGITLEQVEGTMETLVGAHLLQKMELETENGINPSYLVSDKISQLIPFLYMARYLMQSDTINMVGAFVRKDPWLKKSGWKGENKNGKNE